MRPIMRSAVVSLVWGVSLVRSAINLDGTQASKPVTDSDPSPIGDLNTYYPDQHDCPLPCVDYSNIHSWIPYFSVDRLQRCQEPMLLQFSVSQSLNDPDTNVLIRSCTLGSHPGASDRTAIAATAVPMENPKKDSSLVQSSLHIAPACAVVGKEVVGKLELTTSSGSGKAYNDEIAGLLQGMQKFFDAEDNCDENFVFAYHKQTVASVYIGAGLGKPTAHSAFEVLAGRLQNDGSLANRTAAQLCGSEFKTETIFGVSIDTTGDLNAVQKAASDWSQGKCISDESLKPVGDTLNVKVFDIAGAPLIGANNTSNGTLSNNQTSTNSFVSRIRRRGSEEVKSDGLHKRATCTHVQAVSGDGCPSLAVKCGISAADFTIYNPSPTFCSTLQEGDYACCSAGDPYTEPKPDSPVAGADGVCATHLIVNGDSCAALAKQYGLTVDQIESFNKGKTWAWTACKDMLIGYNLCLSEGTAPLPPPQQGSECGPLVPGTLPPTNKSASLADLNPCPLKACCSNWGYCGPFSAHCDIHAPVGGGPGSMEKGFVSTCVSNCGNEIKQNSGPPVAFQRIGYYESWNLDRECLLLKAKNANTDGTYTHIHWGFLTIDPTTWKPIINDTLKQWADFKALQGVKRIASFGGWAYSTEPATYNIIRSAIITNRELFATNIAQFVSDEGIDGIDIDWEYPGAPDILVGGVPIGQTTDGVNYLRFLTSLKTKLGTKSVSIAAPASYWYLKAFPIDRIAAVIDYIVYMTYDLHGQWDYGNVNAFDQCPSGKCIRSHVNLTETRNTLSIITKAGVANNKIFVGEASYGRVFHMAVDGCWGPLCDFTGSRTQSDAKPGRCTKTAGYISNAEINEIIIGADGVQTFHDGASNTDVILYKGDYVSYMTPTTKNTRRDDWKALNFAGSIDWAVDLQEFTSDDMDTEPDRAEDGEDGCVSGRDDTINSGVLCEFSCNYGFCPETLCTCTTRGPQDPLPPQVETGDIIAWDDLDVDLNRLCKFACKYGFCPPDVCTKPVVDADEDGYLEVNDPNNPNNVDYDAIDQSNGQTCQIFKDPKYREATMNQCIAPCAAAVNQAKEDGRTTNFGCVGFWPGVKEIPWTSTPGASGEYAVGKCSCDNWLMNELADIVIDALPIIAQIGCYIIMSSLKLVLDIGLEFVPGVGKILDAGLDMATTAAQVAAYLYPEEEDPEGAFSWWLSPCGGTDLVPDEIKKLFGILSTVADGVSSYKKPKNIPKGSGKKGDDANPVDQSKPKGGTGKGPNGTGSNSGVKKNKKCSVPKASSTLRLGPAKNTLREQSCVPNPATKNVMTTTKVEMIITSISWVANAAPTLVKATCSKSWSQACFHYSSAMRVSPQWSTLTCPQAAATTRYRFEASATATWASQHRGAGWLNPAKRVAPKCDMDEFPPAYLLDATNPAWLNAGNKDIPGGQLVRYLPAGENRGAGGMWGGACFIPAVKPLSDTQFKNSINAAPNSQKYVENLLGVKKTFAAVTVNVHPEFSITEWGHSSNPPPNEGLNANTCWPSSLTPNDPGFTLLTYDAWYGGVAPPKDYTLKV